MSSKQLEERQEREQTEAVARALGMPVAELEAQDWSIEPNVGSDDTIYGYVVTLQNGRKAFLGPSELEIS
jgi:hypothetical protein